MPRLAPPVANRAPDTTRAQIARPRSNSNTHPFFLHSPSSTDCAADALFAHTHEPVAVVDTNSGQIVAWNPAAEQVLGWPCTEAIGQPIERLISPGLLPLHMANLALRRQGFPSNGAQPLDVFVNHAGGSQTRAEVTLVALENERYVLVLLRSGLDGDAVAAANQRIVELEGQLASAAECMQQLETGVGELARDVRRACRSMEHVQRRAERPELGRVAQSARVARRRLQHVARDVDTLDAPAPLELHLERLNLVPLVARVVARARGESPRYRFNMALPQGLTASADPRRIQQVVEILLEQAMTRARGGCWIDVDLRRPFVGQARLEVRDFGRSANQAEREVPSSSGRGERSLLLARTIVALHGGTLEFEFPADGGVRAVVTLPTQHGRALAH